MDSIDIQPLKISTFSTVNSLIFRTSPPSHQIIQFKEPQKNVEIKVIVIKLQYSFRTKKGDIQQYLVADESGCCYMNFFNEVGKGIEEGDILYVSGAYTSQHKNMLLIYQGINSIIKRIGRFHMRFNLAINVSEDYLQQSKEKGK